MNIVIDPLDPQSIEDAVELLNDARDNLINTSDATAFMMTAALLQDAHKRAHVCTGDLERNIAENLANVANTREEPVEGHVSYWAIVDVKAVTPEYRYRPVRFPERWYGEHYAEKQNAANGFFSSSVADLHANLPTFAQGITI